MKKRIVSLVVAFLFIFSTQAFAFRLDSYSRDLRIGLKSMQSSAVTVMFNGDYMFGQELYKSGTSFTINLLNGKLNINGQDYDELQFNSLETSNTITLQSGAKKYSYLGNMVFKPDASGVLPINLIKVDDYVKGIVPYEMSNSYPIEALKAQAVAARNYALTNIGKHGKLGYDLCDGTDCQFYRGYNPAYGRANTAVDETKGKLLLYNGSLVTCYYSASNGGYTEDSSNPWGSAVPYLIVQKDDFDNELWPGGDRKFTTIDIDTKLKEKGIISTQDTFVRIDTASIQRFQNIRISKLSLIVKNTSGVERTVEIKKEGVRTFLSLPSTYYNITYDSTADTYTFSGKGYGHGIGMSQIGAKNRANAGQKYDEILKFYYYGTSIVSVDEAAIALSQDKSMVIVGDEVKFDAVTSGTTSGKLYKYVFILNGTVVYTRDYSSDSSYTFKGDKSGNYNVSLYIKAADSTNQYDELKTSTVSVFQAPVLGDIKILTNSPYANKPVSISYSTIGGSNSGLKYTVEVVKDGSVLETKDIEGLSYTFTPKTAGQYIVRIKVKDPVSSKDVDDVKEIKLDVKVETVPAITFKYSRTLKKGMSGSDVISLQEALKKLGYFKYSSITNYFGSVTQSSVISFQKSNKLTTNGVVDKKTADAINNKLKSNSSTPAVTPSKPTTSSPASSGSGIVFAPARTLKSGMSGSDVKTLQDLLARLKHFKQKSSGYYGSVTVAAVKSFQKSVGLSQTGIVNKKTADTLSSKFSSNSSTTIPVNTSKPAAPVSKPSASSSAPSKSMIVFAPKRTLKAGMSGSDVKTLQDLLARLKFFRQKSTNYFGSVTTSSVKSFQKSVGLKQTGIADAAVVKKINDLINR